jgi:ribulose-phosphate 3-epimerase
MKNNNFLIAASVLGADWLNFGSAFLLAEEAGADSFQIDIADGHFTPTITFGEELVRRLRNVTKLPIEVHLMVANPYEWIPRIASLGADEVIFHVETVNRLQATIELARRHNIGVGLALNTETRVENLEHVLPYVDMITLMAILPGYAGQPFIPETYEKIRRLREMIVSMGNAAPVIEVDGGVKISNIKEIISAGADSIVVSSAIYDVDEPRQSLEKLRDTGGFVGNGEAIKNYLSKIEERRSKRNNMATNPIGAQ